MLLIFGTGEKEKQIQVLGKLQCQNCGYITQPIAVKHYQYVHLFYIPLFHYRAAYYLHCPQCGAIYLVPSGKAKLMKKFPDAVAVPQELQIIRRGMKACINCGRQLEMDALYCPQCGQHQAPK